MTDATTKPSGDKLASDEPQHTDGASSSNEKPPKQVIVLRKDLGMRKGKMVAQGAHASLKVFFDRGYISWGWPPNAADPLLQLHATLTEEMATWFNGSFTKICVSVNSEAELLAIYEKAKGAEVPCSLILDAGKTEFKGPTYTAVAVGPDDPAVVDIITGKLPLL